MPGEFDFISWIRSQQRASDFVQLPAGDDLAILSWKAEDLLLVGVDQVLDGVHFDSSVHTPRQIGKKVMNRNLSDCAAMACLPAAAVATVALPKGTLIEYAKELYLGMKDAADLFRCPIVGGDTGSWGGKLVITVAMLGASAGITPIRRSGAVVGDSIFVTGKLGGSLLGRHMEFKPRIHEARILARTRKVTAMIDLSDGLSRDLHTICQQSGVGAVIRADAIPVHDDAIEMRRDGRTAVEHALHDGEDHELLFGWRTPGETPTIALPGRPADVEEWLPRWIGTFTAEPGVYIEHDGQRTPLEPKGWEHTF
jgi:thiamine-monophosphate kinase